LKSSIAVVQHGFFKGRSAVSNLMEFASLCIRRMEEGIQTDAVYTDFSKLYAEIRVIEDCYAVQRDLDRLCAWCDVNKLYLNARRCKVITFSRAKVQVTYDYSLNC
jgi:hypothetical protein